MRIQPPNKTEQQLAAVLNLALRENSTRGKTRVQLKLNDSDELVEVPMSAVELLRSIVAEIAEGRAVQVISAEKELTTQQAADMLHVSRPHLINLLEIGEIPYRMVGTHRRLITRDVLAFQRKKEAGHRMLDRLSQEAQELNMGY